MQQNQSRPIRMGRIAAERELMETLRGAAWIFEKEKDGRFRGSVLACRAVAHFIWARGYGADLAVPFLNSAEAFEYLEKGGVPTLFSKKIVGDKERSRSPERKHIQRLAAAFLEVLVTHGKEALNPAADRIARWVNGWPGMSAQKIEGKTVVAWRKQLSRTHDQKFRILVDETLKEQDPLRTITEWLQRPHGLPHG